MSRWVVYYIFRLRQSADMKIICSMGPIHLVSLDPQDKKLVRRGVWHTIRTTGPKRPTLSPFAPPSLLAEKIPLISLLIRWTFAARSYFIWKCSLGPDIFHSPFQSHVRNWFTRPWVTQTVRGLISVSARVPVYHPHEYIAQKGLKASNWGDEWNFAVHPVNELFENLISNPSNIARTTLRFD